MIRKILSLVGLWACLVLPVAATDSASSPEGPAVPKDVISYWNGVALDAIRLNATPSPEAARILAMMHVAMFDAVNAIDESYEPYLVDISAPPGASQNVAATSAAHRVLTRLFPQQAWTFDEYMTPVYSSVEEENALKDGIEAGRVAADSVLQWRAKDQSGRKMRYVTQRKPGVWEPTPPDFENSQLPQWSSVQPFAMESGAEFRPEPPPALNSRQYKLEFDQVKELGARESSKRTPEQTEIALFWEAGPGTATTVGQWNLVAEQVVSQQMLSTVDTARVFALLNIALADAGIAAWDAKFRYNFWRPVFAIRSAQTDDNPETIADAAWTPLLTSPAMPEYVSAHSAFSAAAAEVLSELFGDQVVFELVSDDDSRTKRRFTRFTQAAQEAGISRVYGGQHFQSANLEGQKLGRQVGEQVVDNHLRVKGEGSTASNKLKQHFRRTQGRR